MGVNVITAAELGWQEQGFNMKHPVLGTGVDTPLGKSDPTKAAEAARHVRKAISHLIPRDQIVNDLLAGAGYPLASFLGPGWGLWYDSDLKPDTYDIAAAANELRQAGYTVNVAAPPPIAYTGSPMFGSGKVTINGVGRVAAEMVVIQKSTDSGKTWKAFAAAVTGNDTKYQLSALAPPAFGSASYRANFTGYVLPSDLAQKPITPDLVNQYVKNKQYFGGRQLLPERVSDPIVVSSFRNDVMIVAAILIVIVAIVAAVLWKTRKKKAV
jgi:ABC-type transport system substrate-binding protein